MARKKKSSKDAEAEVDQTSVDAIDETTAEDTVKTAADEIDAPTDASGADEVETTEAAEPPDTNDGADQPDGTADEVTNDTDDDHEAQPSDEPVIKAETAEQVNILENPPAPVPEPIVVRKGGFVPMVLGGIVAAAIGFGMARYVLPDAGPDAALVTDMQRKLDVQISAIAKLNERIETLEAGGDLTSLEAAQSDNLAAISGLADRLSQAEARLADIEARPASEGASGAALAAYERQLTELRSAVDAMNENAALMEENAQAAARATLQRAALTRIQTALDAGVGFASAVADLEGLGVNVPPVLQDAAPDGVPSLADLQASFPDAARAALVAARVASDGSGGGGVTSFLRNQLGARSLQPREGNDPDAVLSRAEAAARDGRLTDALAEVEALPEEGRAELSDWSNQATRRLEVVAAVQELGESLN